MLAAVQVSPRYLLTRSLAIFLRNAPLSPYALLCYLPTLCPYARPTQCPGLTHGGHVQRGSTTGGSAHGERGSTAGSAHRGQSQDTVA
eukprot:3575858-Rhodomonas_salina.1